MDEQAMLETQLEMRAQTRNHDPGKLVDVVM